MVALESEIAKQQMSLDNARTAYQSLQKQYQEQCSMGLSLNTLHQPDFVAAESERYCNSIRRRDQELKDLQDAATLHALEAQKWTPELESYERRIIALEGDLSIAQQAHAQLDEQRQDNLMLKETIDRMRFEMDEMRNNASGLGSGAGSRGSSQKGSLSKSLGAELLSKMGPQWGMEDEGSDVEEFEPDERDTEAEDVIQTIITRKMRVCLSSLSLTCANTHGRSGTGLKRSLKGKNIRMQPPSTMHQNILLRAQHRPTRSPVSSGQH